MVRPNATTKNSNTHSQSHKGAGATTRRGRRPASCDTTTPSSSPPPQQAKEAEEEEVEPAMTHTTSSTTTGGAAAAMRREGTSMHRQDVVLGSGWEGRGTTSSSSRGGGTKLEPLERAVVACSVVVVVAAVHAAHTMPEWLPVEAFVVVVVSTFTVAVLIPFMYHRRPATGFIAGNESMNLVTTYENRPTIHGFTLVQGKLTVEEVISEMHRVGVPHKRFKRFSYSITRDYRTRESFDPDTDWPAYFYQDPDFDLANHVRYINFHSKGKNTNNSNKNGGGGASSSMSRADMLQYLSSIINTPPSLDRPPWEILLAQDFDGSDVTAVVFRVHHVLADGLALVTFMDAITRPAPGANEQQSSLAAAARVGLKMMADCSVLVKAAMYLRLLVEFPIIMMKDYVLPRPDRNIFKKPLTGRKKLGWSMNRLPMSRVKAVKNAYNAKINDLFLSCATGTLRNIAASRAAAAAPPPPPGGATSSSADRTGGGDGMSVVVPPEMKMYTPISVRDTLDDCHDLSNMLSVLLIPLPTRLEDPVKRLRHIEKLMNVKKRSIVPWGLARIMGTMGTMPRAILAKQMAFLYDKVTAVMTNVPGPSHKRTIAGRTIEEMMFWVPGLGSIGIVLSIFTYGDKVSLGVVVDEGLPFAPEDFLEEFWREFAKMEQLMVARQR